MLRSAEVAEPRKSKKSEKRERAPSAIRQSAGGFKEGLRTYRIIRGSEGVRLKLKLVSDSAAVFNDLNEAFRSIGLASEAAFKSAAHAQLTAAALRDLQKALREARARLDEEIGLVTEELAAGESAEEDEPEQSPSEDAGVTR